MRLGVSPANVGTYGLYQTVSERLIFFYELFHLKNTLGGLDASRRKANRPGIEPWPTEWNSAIEAVANFKNLEYISKISALKLHSRWHISALSNLLSSLLRRHVLHFVPKIGPHSHKSSISFPSVPHPHLLPLNIYCPPVLLTLLTNGSMCERER